MNGPVRQKVGGAAMKGLFHGMARAGRLHPRARRALREIRTHKDVAYGEHASQRLDVYLPEGEGPHPVLVYVHGGGFKILSKDSHWLMGLRYARRGFVVFNVEYRLAPDHPYPAAIEDVCKAYAWVAEHAAAYGGDVGRLVIAGESAGGNLVTSLAIATCWRRPEPWAAAAFDAGVVPKGVLAIYGIYETSDPRRFGRRRPLPWWLEDRLVEVCDAYVPAHVPREGDGLDLADPVRFLERGQAPDRPLPPFWAPVGTRDPLLDDTRRLKKAIDALGGECEAVYYPGEVHAFHVLLWRENARKCWDDMYGVLDAWIPVRGTQSSQRPAKDAKGT